MLTEDVVFSNQTVQLAGTLHKPDALGPYPALVVLHAANGGTRQYAFYQHLTQQLPARSVAVLLFDRRGSGASAGDFETASFETLASDGCAAVDYLRSRADIDKARIGAYGISQGGWIVPLMAAQRPDLALLIIVSGCGVSPAAQMNYGARYTLEQAGFSAASITEAIALRNRVNDYYRGRIPRATVVAELEAAQAEPWYELAYLGPSQNLPHDVKQGKWWYEMDYDPLPVWQHIQQPTLFVFAEVDQWVPIAESMAHLGVATAHLPDVTQVRVAGTDHLMGHLNSAQPSEVSHEYIEVLVDWLTQRLRLG